MNLSDATRFERAIENEISTYRLASMSDERLTLAEANALVNILHALDEWRQAYAQSIQGKDTLFLVPFTEAELAEQETEALIERGLSSGRACQGLKDFCVS